MKRCWKCCQEKPESEFGKDRSRSDGLNPKCRFCVRKTSSEFYWADPDRANSYTRKSRNKNPDRFRERDHEYKAKYKTILAEKKRKWVEQNKDRERARQSAYVKANRHKYNAHAMKRHAQKLKATPAWANHERIAREYELAAWCSDVTGIKYEVDHIIPLQGENVCGLHVEYNLQVITAFENRRKNNRYEIA